MTPVETSLLERGGDDGATRPWGDMVGFPIPLPPVPGGGGGCNSREYCPMLL